jgi:glycosyltransferase involved in cell wall biosynthesis
MTVTLSRLSQSAATLVPVCQAALRLRGERVLDPIAVIAYPLGSVSELIDDGETGFLVKDIGEAVSAVHRIEEIDRVICRQVFDNRFTAARMASDYVELYEQLTRGEPVGIDKLFPRIVNSPRDSLVSDDYTEVGPDCVTQ